MEGDFTRGGSFGRATAAGVLRFGTDYVVSTRLGFGVQGTSYESTFTGATGAMTGPGNGFEFDTAWIGGASFDARIGDHWSLGLAATTVDWLNAETRSFEMGLHVGYGWNMRPNPKE